MFLWFIGTAVISVWYVFRDARFDYRLLAVGALLPDAIDLPSGYARWAHSLVATVATLVLVMLITVGRKPIRRLLLALPIGCGTACSPRPMCCGGRWPGRGARCACRRCNVAG